MNISAHGVEFPIPISSNTYVGQSHGQPIIHHENHNHPSNGSHPLSIEDQNQNHNHNNIKIASLVVKYRECLKNHAASIGGNATDGCGEFMPSGEEGTIEALKCSACNCHRNFHRKEIGGEPNSSCTDCFHHLKSGRKLLGGQKGVLISSISDLIPRPTPHNMIMPLGAAAIQTSESDAMGGYYSRPPFLKKRFRTKFSAEQKVKMLAFAERVGWKLQKQEESVVQQLCQEIGVKRRVLKVWMHNNKHNLAKMANNITPSNLNESAQIGIADSRGGLI